MFVQAVIFDAQVLPRGKARPLMLGVQPWPAEVAAGVEGERHLVTVRDISRELAERGLDEVGDRATRLGPAESGARGGHGTALRQGCAGSCRSQPCR